MALRTSMVPAEATAMASIANKTTIQLDIHSIGLVNITHRSVTFLISTA
jgi:hypothetical protein